MEEEAGGWGGWRVRDELREKEKDRRDISGPHLCFICVFYVETMCFGG